VRIGVFLPKSWRPLKRACIASCDTQPAVCADGFGTSTSGAPSVPAAAGPRTVRHHRVAQDLVNGLPGRGGYGNEDAFIEEIESMLEHYLKRRRPGPKKNEK
jgi:hypothetical protein